MTVLTAIPTDLLGERPHLVDLLRDAGLATGGSPRGWSAISAFAKCPRLAYFQFVEGLRPKRPSAGLDVGTLGHMCLERHYLTGGQDTWKPLDAIKEHLPELAFEVRRLLDAYFARYAYQEATTWDVRAVEYDAHAELQGRPIKGKWAGRLVRAPITCRFDLIVAAREPNAPCAPFGPAPQGVYVVDHKFYSALTRDAIRGFSLDGQFLSMATIWQLGRLDQTFGRLNGFIINAVIKTKQVQLQRLEVQIDQRDIDRFRPVLARQAVEFHSRLAAPHRRTEDQWEMNVTSCISRYGACRFFDLCESHGDLHDLYERDPAFVPYDNLVAKTRKKIARLVGERDDQTAAKEMT